MTCLLEENICLHLTNKLCVYYQDGVLLMLNTMATHPIIAHGISEATKWHLSH